MYKTSWDFPFNIWGGYTDLWIDSMHMRTLTEVARPSRSVQNTYSCTQSILNLRGLTVLCKATEKTWLPLSHIHSYILPPDLPPPCLVPKADAHTESYNDNRTNFLGLLVALAMISSLYVYLPRWRIEDSKERMLQMQRGLNTKRPTLVFFLGHNVS